MIPPSTPPDSPTDSALIYVVDDEPMLLELATYILRPRGYRLKTFRNPEQALESFKAEDTKPDLLITDFAMDPMNGVELIQQCKVVDPELPTILVSGTVDEDIFQDQPVRGDRFIGKPYRAEELVRAVEEVLRQ